MKIRHCMLWSLVFLLLGVAIAGANTPPQEGFVFDETTETEAMKKPMDPMESYLLSVEEVCASISELCARYEGVIFFDTDQLHSLRAQFLSLLFQPAQESALARLNTSEFRALRSVALNLMDSGAALLRDFIVVYKLQMEMKTWNSSGPLGGMTLGVDLENLTEQREEIENFLSRHSYVFSEYPRTASWQSVIDLAIISAERSDFTNRDGSFNAKASNALTAMIVSIKACERVKEEYNGPFNEVWDQWMRTKGAWREAKTLLVDAEGGLLRVRRAVTDAMNSLENHINQKFDWEDKEILNDFVKYDVPRYREMYDRHTYQMFRLTADKLSRFIAIAINKRNMANWK